MFRRAIIKFIEAATVALGDAESEMQRRLNWLENEQDSYWQGQIRKRKEDVSKAQDAVRQKKIFKDFAGRTPSADQEEKALRIALQRLEDAERKLVAVRRYARKLPKEIEVYKGTAQRFATTVQTDLPTAAGKLDAMIRKLEEYAALGPAAATSVAASTDETGTVPTGAASMARGEGEVPAPQSSPPVQPDQPPAEEQQNPAEKRP
jgi:exonuclease VII large subunit